MSTTRAARRPATHRGRTTQAVLSEDAKVRFELAGIALTTVGAITGVALAGGVSGPLGAAIRTGLLTALGLGAWSVPLALVGCGAYLALALKPLRLHLKVVSAVGLGLAALGAAHSWVPEGLEFDPAAVATHGGWLGGAMVLGLRSLLGPIGCGIILSALALASGSGLLTRPMAHIAQDAYGAVGARAARARGTIGGILAQRRRRAAARAAERRRRAPRVPEDQKADRRRRFRRATVPPETGEVPVVADQVQAPPPEDHTIVGTEAVVLGEPPSEDTGELTIPAFLRAQAARRHAEDTLHFPAEPSGQHSMLPALGLSPEKPGPWAPPDIDLLDGPTPADVRRQEREAAENIAILEDTLASFGVAAKVVAIERGPAITRYELEPAKGVRVAKISALVDDLTRVLAAMYVRIEAPVPGTSVVGIEVPNKTRTLVTLREILESEQLRAHKSKLAFALGKDIAGKVVVGDLCSMPHMLVAGTTNGGKSVCLNALILSIIYRASPDDVKFMMIDPKRVELSLYEDIPHLIAPVVCDAKETAGLLRQAIAEMEDRYRVLASAGVRNITEYLELRHEHPDLEAMPYIVIVIDELADLMMQAPAEFEHSICRIAQLARAVGIHLVVATQRPSVNVVTGTIKANIPSRTAFKVSSQTDSRVILDQVGAERLIGKGDMLYSPIDASKPRRVQGAYVGAKEINRVVKHQKQWGAPEFLMEPIPVETLQSGATMTLPGGITDAGVDDDRFAEIVQFVTRQRRVSASMLQRKFRIGYNRAARLVEILEEKGIVGPADGSKPRKVLTPFAAGGIEEDYGEDDA